MKAWIGAARAHLRAERKAAGPAPVALTHPAFGDRRVHFTQRGWNHAVASLSRSVREVKDPRAAPAHLDAVRVLPELFRQSVITAPRPAAKGSGEVIQIYRAFSAMRHESGLYAVKMTIREHAAGNLTLEVDSVRGLVLYDMHLRKRMPAEEGTWRTPAGASSPTDPRTPYSLSAGANGIEDTIILRALLEGVKDDAGDGGRRAGGVFRKDYLRNKTLLWEAERSSNFAAGDGEPPLVRGGPEQRS